MVETKDTIGKDAVELVEQAIEDDIERKEEEERQERREGTKYGEQIDGEIER